MCHAHLYTTQLQSEFSKPGLFVHFGLEFEQWLDNQSTVSSISMTNSDHGMKAKNSQLYTLLPFEYWAGHACTLGTRNFKLLLFFILVASGGPNFDLFLRGCKTSA